MLNPRERESIAEVIGNGNYVISFKGVNQYVEWLKIYTNDHDIIEDIIFNKRGIGTATAKFIMNCTNESKVIDFTSRMLTHLIDYDDTTIYDDEYEADILHNAITTLKNIIHLTDPSIFPTKNLKDIKKQTRNKHIKNRINNLFDDFNKVSKFKYKDDEERLGNTYQDIILNSYLLLNNIFNLILTQCGYKNISNKIIKKENAVYKELNLKSNPNEKINKEPNIQIRNNEKSNSGLIYILNGIRDINNNLLKKIRIIDGLKEIVCGLNTLRNTTSKAHTQTTIPTAEETILYLNISSTLSRFLLHRSNYIRNKNINH